MPKLSADVVVVGAGAAGCFAAIRAKESGTSVVIVEKAIAVRSGNAGGGEKDIACHLNEGENWDSDDAARKWLTSGATGNYPFIEKEVAEINVARIREVVTRLEKYGLEFRRETDGKYFHSQSIGTPGKYLLWFKNGHEFKRRVDRQVRLAGVKVLERVYVSGLIVVEGRVCGIKGFNIMSGETHTILAKSVILSTGEAVRMYSNNKSSNTWSTWHSPYNNGTAQSLAFKAGAEITGLEFTRTTLHPIGFGATGSAVFFGFGGFLVNSNGERYMKRYHTMGELAPRDVLAFATIEEIEHGRGPCYVDLRHQTPEKIKTILELQTHEFPGYKYYYEQMEIDLRKDLVPIEVGSLFAAGGILINGRCETSVPGLFAAGDCTYARAGLPMALTTGIEAGERAAEQARCQVAQKTSSLTDANQFPNSHKKPGIRAAVLLEKLHGIMDTYVGWHRTEEGLSFALSKISELETMENELLAYNTHDLMRVHEAMDLVTIAKLIAAGAKLRKESRGWHRRDDYPNENPSFQGHFILRNNGGGDDDGGIQTYFHPVRVEN